MPKFNFAKVAGAKHLTLPKLHKTLRLILPRLGCKKKELTIKSLAHFKEVLIRLFFKGICHNPFFSSVGMVIKTVS